MKLRYLIVPVIFTLSMSAWAEDEKDPSIVALARNMGVDTLIDATKAQTEDALNKMMLDLAPQLKDQLPPLNEEQEGELDKILTSYVSRILGAIDTDEATYIYTKAIAGGLSPKEVEQANEYYSSDEGKRLLKVVGEASGLLNHYLLTQITEATKIAQQELSENIAEFKSKVTLKKSEQDK